jgi:predicted nucleic acid-binding protein
MHLVVADTSPLFYLLSIDQIELLMQLFGTVLVPESVHRELSHQAAPARVRGWATQPPDWLKVMQVDVTGDAQLAALGAGEGEAIALALSSHATLILIDERKGTILALKKGLEATGTLGVLALAARHGLVDLEDCFARLKRTTFRYRQKILDDLLDQQKTTQQ